MPKILVSNLPVTTFINAEVTVDDGPEETLQERILTGVLAGRWGTLQGEHSDSAPELNEQVLYPRWSFDILAGGPADDATPGPMGPGPRLLRGCREGV